MCIERIVLPARKSLESIPRPVRIGRAGLIQAVHELIEPDFRDLEAASRAVEFRFLERRPGIRNL